jgi:homopolymeric O-antigen transport system permease protein
VSRDVPPAAQKTVIEAGHVERHYWRDLWRYRELLYLLAWRDVTVRYKQTVIGTAWAVIRPVTTMLILVLVFGKVARLPSGGIPYPVLVLTGMLAWQLFAAGLSATSDSLVGSAGLISKVYFPRLIIPLSALAVGIVDFLVTMPLLVALMLWYGVVPTWRMAAFPAFVLLTVLAGLSLGIWMSALAVRYRDVRVLIPFILQFGLYLSPVGYATAVVPVEYRTFYSLNPMVGVIEGFRWCLLGQAEGLTPLSLGVSVGAVTVLLGLGLRYFRWTERSFADVI